MEHPERCVVISNIRGDLELLKALLLDVTKVAVWENDQWQWMSPNTVLVILGDLVDRFPQSAMPISTKKAIEEEIQIIQILTTLKQQAPKFESYLVVLMGDHEVGNLARWSGYAKYEMAYPDSEEDQTLRLEFIERYLRPFCADCGVVARWGNEAGQIYFSHAGLSVDWLSKVYPKLPGSAQDGLIERINLLWKQSTKHKSHRFTWFEDEKSPLLYPFLTESPMLWRRQEKYFVQKAMKQNPNERSVFVTADKSIQDIQASPWTGDILMKGPHCEKMPRLFPPVLVSKDGGTDDLYFIHNASADTFCAYGDQDRIPQALQFTVMMNEEEKGLYWTCQLLTLSSDLETRWFLDRPARCIDEKVYDVQKAPDLVDEVLPLNKSLPFTEPERDRKNYGERNQLVNVYVMLLNHQNGVFLLRLKDPDRWGLPYVKRKPHETSLEAAHRTLPFSWPDVETPSAHYDYNDETRVIVYQLKGPFVQEHASGKWVAYHQVLSRTLDPMTRSLFLRMHQDGFLSLP